VFHCSAGIGRTGTIMAIYNVLQSINILLENNPNKIQLPVSPITPKEFPKPEDLIKEN